MEIEKIAVLIQTKEGTAHQVLTTKKQKEVYLKFLCNEETGNLQVSEEIEAIDIKFKSGKQ